MYAMTSKLLDLKTKLSSLPPVYAPSPTLRLQIRDQLRLTENIPLLIILDDDPTGTQTCHDISVITTWTVPILTQEFENTRDGFGFFILTNTRALHPGAASALIREICINLQKASVTTGKSFEIVLRGDSTLRGHFPTEPKAIEETLGQSDAWILAPFFLQGGRYTIDDVHYVADGDNLVPAAETAFAGDATFGYKNSDLKKWVVEKSKGTITTEKILGLELVNLRKEGPTYVRDQLLQAPEGAVVIVNAAAEEDIDVVVLGVLQATAQGCKFLFRTAAAFVSSRLGIDPIPPLTCQQLNLSPSTGGLIVVGSYVPKTTAQVVKLIRDHAALLTTVEVSVETLLQGEEAIESVIMQAVEVATDELKKAQDVLVMTSRGLVTGDNEEESLNIGTVVAEALVKLVQRISVRPRYIIAKGGITSSDVATKALRMKRASVTGQALPGVPLWQSNEIASKYPGLPLVIFPGNVGSEDALYNLVRDWHV